MQCKFNLLIRTALERLQDKCAKENKFVEAELCKQRLEYFKNLEKEKLLENVKERHKKAVRLCFIRWNN